MRTFRISPEVQAKLRDRHQVTTREISQCFENLCGTYLEDSREEHKTDPATLWFVAPTNQNRLLKVVFICIDGNIHIKSAFEPRQVVIDLYERFGK
jgi:hypothetical protein